MPPTSDKAPRRSTLGLTGLPDRDNPLAWKRKTREGRRGAHDLLTALTDEEVARYITLAHDQMRLEERLMALKALSAVCGAGLIGAIAWHGSRVGLGSWHIAGLGLGVAMGYWPWRVLKCRQMWKKHFEAARAEQLKRQVPA
jgi:hypothetical protein